MLARLIKHFTLFSVCLFDGIIMADTLALEEDKRTGKHIIDPVKVFHSESCRTTKGSWNKLEKKASHRDTERKNTKRHAIWSIIPSLPSTPTPVQAMHLIKCLYTYPRACMHKHSASLLLDHSFALRQFHVPAPVLSRPALCYFWDLVQRQHHRVTPHILSLNSSLRPAIKLTTLLI